MKKVIAVFFLAMALVFPSATYALDKTNTGFVYPIGTENFDTSGGYWLSKPPDYFAGYYHVGIDMMTNAKAGPVYAIADGKIIYISYDDPVKDKGDKWGNGNCALVIEHKKNNGQVFTAIYGHLVVKTLPKKLGDELESEEKIGETGPYKTSTDHHLHFSIHDGPFNGTDGMAKIGWGRMPISEWPNQNTFTNPISFMENNRPLNYLSDSVSTACLGNLCWEPADKSCEEASRWFLYQDKPYLISGMPLVSEVGCGYCEDAKRQAQMVAEDKASREVPEDHWWQSWFRKIFGNIANAQEEVDINELIVYRVITPYDDDSSILLSGNGAQSTDAYGQGYYANPNDEKIPDLSDLTSDEVRLTTSDDHERYKFNPPETVKMKTEFSNIGPGNPTHDITVHWYLSEGYKEDSHSDWKRIAEDNIKWENLSSGDTHSEEADFVPEDEGLEPGIYNIVACIDHPEDDHNNGGDIPEEHESNNCSTEAVFEVRDPNAPTEVDISIPTISLKSASTPIRSGDGIGACITVKNIGIEDCPAVIRSVYEIYGPATNYLWQQIADDGTDAEELKAGQEKTEETYTLVPAPSIPGIYWIRARADYLNAVLESDENNNTSPEIEFEVLPPIVRKIIITSPKSGDIWRTDKEYKIQWTSQNIDGKLKIEYSINGGSSWNSIDSSATNDGSKKWKPPKDKINKDTNCYIRITSLSYPKISAISPKFKVDHRN